MTDAGNGFPLEAGGGREQRPRGGKDDALETAVPETGEQVAIENSGGTAAAGGPGVHILLLAVIEQKAAVLEPLPHVDAVPHKELPDDIVAQSPQVAGEDQVVIRGLCSRVPEEGSQGVVGRRGRSQGCTMWKMFSVKFNAYSSPEARRF